MTATDDPHADVKQHAATPEMLAGCRVVRVPTKIQKRHQQFIKVPWSWAERLTGATGHTFYVALYLLHQHFREHGRPIKLSNGMLKIDGVSRYSKWRALDDLERRGLIEVERRPKKVAFGPINHAAFLRHVGVKSVANLRHDFSKHAASLRHTVPFYLFLGFLFL